MNTLIRCVASTAILAILVIPVTAQVGIPRTLSLQGVLADQLGNPLLDGDHELVISLYDVLTGGTPLFSRAHTVSVRRGVFEAIVDVPVHIPFDRTYYLGVMIDGGTELIPRSRLTASPYAFHAFVADSVLGGHVKSVNGSRGDVTVVSEVSNTDGSIAVTNPSGPAVALGVRPDGIQTHHLRDNAATATKLNTEGAAIGFVLKSNGGATPIWGVDRLSLPFEANVGDTRSLFSLSNTGTGTLTTLSNRNGGATDPVLEAFTTGTGTIVSVANFAASQSPAERLTGVNVSLKGTNRIGVAVDVSTSAATFAATTPGGVYAHAGSGSAIQGSATSGVGVFGGASTGTGVVAHARGTGNALVAISENGGTSTPTGGNIALFKNTAGSGNVARISNTGRGYFNGGTQTSGADVAESFDCVGDRALYEPGDVLVISAVGDRTVERSYAPYATTVVGVYATRPGLLLSDRDINADHADRIPMGVVGVIATKVTNENGVIRRGDLLVTSSTPGHAMKASPITVNGVSFFPSGVVIGKALENFDGERGVIEVMVNVK